MLYFGVSWNNLLLFVAVFWLALCILNINLVPTSISTFCVRRTILACILDEYDIALLWTNSHCSPM